MVERRFGVEYLSEVEYGARFIQVAKFETFKDAQEFAHKMRKNGKVSLIDFEAEQYLETMQGTD